MNNDPSIIKDMKKKITSYLSKKKKITSYPSMFKDEKKKITSYMNSNQIIHINGEYGIGKTRLIKDVISEKDKNIKDKNIKDKNIKDKNIKDKNIKDKNIKDKNIKDKNIKDKNIKDKNTKDKNIILIEDMIEFDGNDIPWYKLRKNKSLPKLINAYIWFNSLKNIMIISLGFILPFIPILWNIQAIEFNIKIKIIVTIISIGILIFFFAPSFFKYKCWYATCGICGIFSRKKPKNIFIENIDRLPWDDAYKLLREAYLLKESKKNLTFFFSYSQQKLKRKFLLRYGKEFESFTVIDEIEKYIDNIINLDDSVKNVRYEIIDSIFKEELKNENYNDKLDMVNKIKIETKKLYGNLNINNFRILKKSIKETIECHEIISALQLNETIIFKLKMLLHLDIETYLNLEKDIKEIQEEYYDETNQLFNNRSKQNEKEKYWEWIYDDKKEKVQDAYIGYHLLIKEIINDIIDHGNKNLSTFKTHNKMDYSWKVYFLGKNYQDIMKLFNKEKYYEIYLKNDVDMVYRTLAFQKIEKKKYDFAILFKMITDMTQNEKFRLREIRKIVNFGWDNLNELELWVLINHYIDIINIFNFSDNKYKNISDFCSKIKENKLEKVVKCLLNNMGYFSKNSNHKKYNYNIIILFNNMLKSLVTKFEMPALNADQIIKNITNVSRVLESNNTNMYTYLIKPYFALLNLKWEDNIKILEHFKLFTIDISLAYFLGVTKIIRLTKQKDKNGISKYKLSYSFPKKVISINNENLKDVKEIFNEYKQVY